MKKEVKDTNQIFDETLKKSGIIENLNNDFTIINNEINSIKICKIIVVIRLMKNSSGTI